MYNGAGKPIFVGLDGEPTTSKSPEVNPIALLIGFGGAAYLGWYLYKAHLARAQLKGSLANPLAKKATVADINSNNGNSVSKGRLIKTDGEVEPYPEISVVIHQCPRGYMTPCIAPFPLKLETFLRVTGIPYEVDFSISPNDRSTPWLTIDNEDLLESHECVERLSQVFDVYLEDNAQTSRLIASRLVGVVLENHIYWGIALWRWVYDEGRSLPQIQPLSSYGMEAIRDIRSSVIRASWYHGLGRLSQKQVIELILKDLGDLSIALGKHPYFLGEFPGEVDCAAFAMLAQMIWNMPGSPFEAGVKQYKNLVDFVLRIRDKFWPDWENLLQVRGQENLDTTSASVILPGYEFLDKRQLNSDSSHWDSKASSSAATLKNLQIMSKSQALPEIEQTKTAGTRMLDDETASEPPSQPMLNRPEDMSSYHSNIKSDNDDIHNANVDPNNNEEQRQLQLQMSGQGRKLKYTADEPARFNNPRNSGEEAVISNGQGQQLQLTRNIAGIHAQSNVSCNSNANGFTMRPSESRKSYSRPGEFLNNNSIPMYSDDYPMHSQNQHAIHMNALASRPMSPKKARGGAAKSNIASPLSHRNQNESILHSDGSPLTLMPALAQQQQQLYSENEQQQQIRAEQVAMAIGGLGHPYVHTPNRNPNNPIDNMSLNDEQEMCGKGQGGYTNTGGYFPQTNQPNHSFYQHQHQDPMIRQGQPQYLPSDQNQLRQNQFPPHQPMRQQQPFPDNQIAGQQQLQQNNANPQMRIHQHQAQVHHSFPQGSGLQRQNGQNQGMMLQQQQHPGY